MARKGATLEKEIAFIESIDAHFPFRDETAARTAVIEGAATSDNAALMIACELAFAHESVPASPRLALLKLLVEQRPSPLVLAAAPVVEAFICGAPPPADAAAALFAQCKVGPPCYNALNILEECSADYATAVENLRGRV